MTKTLNDSREAGRAALSASPAVPVAQDERATLVLAAIERRMQELEQLANAPQAPSAQKRRVQTRYGEAKAMRDVVAASLSASTPSAASLEFNGWYCAHCQRGVDSSEVTFHEQHQECGRVITNDRPPQPAVSADARDAARYRWLRDKFGDMKLSASERVLSALGLEDDPVASLDAIIDAAMAPPAASPAQQLREATAREGHCKQCRALYPQHHAGCTRPADNKENGEPRRKLKPMPVGWTRDALRRAGFGEDDNGC